MRPPGRPARSRRARKGALCSRRSSPISRSASPRSPASRNRGAPLRTQFVPLLDGLDRVCAEEPLRPESADASERLERMEGHAAAMQAMFGAMAKAYETIAPVLTACSTRHPFAEYRPVAANPGPSPRRRLAALGYRRASETWPRAAAQTSRNCRLVPWGPPPF